MPRFAANLSMMFNEVPFLDRFALAAKAGFKGVEFLFPYEHPAAEIAARLKDNGLPFVCWIRFWEVNPKFVQNCLDFGAKTIDNFNEHLHRC